MKPTKDTRFKIGDRVKYSDVACQRKYDAAMNLGRSHRYFNNYMDAAREMASLRGVVTAAGHNGYSEGATVKWNNGSTSESMQHMLMPADTPRIGHLQQLG